MRLSFQEISNTSHLLREGRLMFCCGHLKKIIRYYCRLFNLLLSLQRFCQCKDYFLGNKTIKNIYNQFMEIYKGHIVDVVSRRIFDGEVAVDGERIASIRECEIPADCRCYIMPGFVNSHVHIESSMMMPSEFARIGVENGTIGAVNDPHEIANVMGEEGIDFMIESAKQIPFNFCFGAPSCVPSCGTDIETSGRVLNSEAIERLMQREEIGFLSEMMNYPGVLNGDPEVMKKIAIAKKYGKPVDGHAPGLMGEDRKRYADAGISTDHECSSLEEGRDCIKAGMKVLIREGSAACDFDSLKPLIAESPDMLMFCTDDSHPGDSVGGHIMNIAARAISDGYDIWDVLNIACVNPQKHYNLNWGWLQEGHKANFIIVDDVKLRGHVIQTIINGIEVYNRDSFSVAIKSQNKSLQNQMSILNNYPNNFVAQPITADDIALELKPGTIAHVIHATDGSLYTEHEEILITGDPLKDSQYPWHEVQKIVVYNRYTVGAKPHVALVRGFNLKDGALASTVAHDCHNIVAVGSNDRLLVMAINRIVEMKGGQVALTPTDAAEIALPIAGLISPLSGEAIAFHSMRLNQMAKNAGCQMEAPFITLAFMCLPVIPELKLTDKGLFDSSKWSFL